MNLTMSSVRRVVVVAATMAMTLSLVPMSPAQAAISIGAPTGVSAAAGASGGTIDVTWTAPTPGAGVVLTGFGAGATLSGQGSPAANCQANAAATSCTISGLAAGTYNVGVKAFAVSATDPNDQAQSTVAVAGSSVTVTTKPGVPTNVQVTAGNAQVTVTWDAPASNGGSVITKYTVVAKDGGSPAGNPCEWTTGDRTCTVTGLTNDTTYSLVVTATNAVGTSNPSVGVNATPTAGGGGGGSNKPSAPKNVQASGGDQQVTVSWSQPDKDGGSAITKYTAYATDPDSPQNPKTCEWTDGPLGCTITGLTNGKTYLVTVIATNVNGDGTASDAVEVTAGASTKLQTPEYYGSYLRDDKAWATFGYKGDASKVTGFQVKLYTSFSSVTAVATCETAGGPPPDGAKSYECGFSGLANDGVSYVVRVVALAASASDNSDPAVGILTADGTPAQDYCFLQVHGTTSAGTAGVGVTLVSAAGEPLASKMATLSGDTLSWSACFNANSLDMWRGAPTQVVVSAQPSSGPTTAKTFPLSECQAGSGCAVTFAASAQLTGKVVRQGDNPAVGVQGATVNFYREIGQGQPAKVEGSAMTNASGNYSISGLPAGSYWVEANPPKSISRGYLTNYAPDPIAITDQSVDVQVPQIALRKANVILKVVAADAPSVGLADQSGRITKDGQEVDWLGTDGEGFFSSQLGNGTFTIAFDGREDMGTQNTTHAVVMSGGVDGVQQAKIATWDGTAVVYKLVSGMPTPFLDNGATPGSWDDTDTQLTYVLKGVDVAWQATMKYGNGSPASNISVFAQPYDGSGNLIECPQGQNNTCPGSMSAKSTGKFSLNLVKNTAYRIVANPFGDPNATETAVRVVTDGAGIPYVDADNDGALDQGEAAFAELVMGAPNVRFKVVGVGGAALKNVWVGAMIPNSPGGGAGAPTGNDGVAGLSLSSGIYILNLNDNSGSGLYSNLQQPIQVSVVGDVVTIAKCSSTYGQEGPCQKGTLPWAKNGAGQYEIAMPGANVTGTVCAPGTPCSGVARAGVDIQRKVEQGGGYYYTWVTWANGNESGNFSAYLSEAGDYKLTARRPYNSSASWVESSIYVRVSAGGLLCVLNQEGGTCVADPAASLSNVKIYFESPNVTGTVLVSKDVPLTNGWVEVSQACTDFDGCFRSIGGSSLNSQGKFALTLPAGTYTFTVWPNNSNGTAVSTRVTQVVAASGTTDFTITMKSANVSGTIVLGNGSTAAKYAQIGVDRDVSGTWQWANVFAQSDSSGQFQMSLDPGKYRLRFEPGDQDRAGNSVVFATIVVDANGVLTQATGSGITLGGDGKMTVQFGSPNVAGKVFVSGETAAGFAWIEVRKWDGRSRSYQWTPDVQGTSTDYQGQYALNLPVGQWQLVANPPWGSASATKNSVNLCVANVAGTATAYTESTAGKADCSEAQALSPARTLNITLGSPNVQGTVKAGGANVAYTWLNVERQTAWGWNWADVWANTDANGAFAMNIADPGVYRLTANPTGSTAGYSQGSVYAIVQRSGGSNVICSVTKADATFGATCPGSPGVALTGITISLTGANFTGTVTASGSPVPYSWIGIQQGTEASGFTWMGGTNTNNTGQFNVFLDAVGGKATSYRLEFNPPWNNSSGLSRKSKDYVAYPSGGSSLVCDKANFTAPATCSVALVTDIALSSGNVKGSVVEPDVSKTPVANSPVNVEKWTQAPWNPSQYFWQWANVWANTNTSGEFSMNLDSAGTYRITGNPSWENPNGYSRGVAVITVKSDGAWCAETERPSSGTADAFNAEACGPWSTAESRLEVSLQGANVGFVVRESATDASSGLVADAYVGLARKSTVTDANGSFTNYEWLGGSPTNANGEFFTTLTAGTYRVEVNPPWQGDAASLTRFSFEIKVSCSGDSCTFAKVVGGSESGTYSKASPLTVGFPSASVVGKVCDKDSTTSCIAVANSGVNVLKLVSQAGQPDRYEWIDAGTGTNRAGEFRLALADGDYKLEANPSWQNPVGLRTEVSVRVTSGIATCLSGCSPALDATADVVIKLGSSNFSGTLVYDGGTPMPFGWVQVTRADGSMVTGGQANADGAFELSLPNGGPYTFTAFPNWQVAKRPPVTSGTTVTVTGGTASPTTLTLDFDAVTPNVTVTIGGTTASRTVAVLRVEGGTETLLDEMTATSSGGATNTAKFALPSGFTYKFVVIPDLGETNLTNNDGSINVAEPGTPYALTITPVVAP